MKNEEKQNNFGMAIIEFLSLRKECWETSGLELTFGLF